MKWVKSHLIFSYYFITYISNLSYTTEKLLTNEIINFLDLMHMMNLSLITLIKMFLFFLTPVVALFRQVCSIHNFLLSCVIRF